MKKNYFFLIALCAYFITSAQDFELKVYKNIYKQQSKFDTQNLTKGSYEYANSNAFKNYKDENQLFVIDFQDDTKDITVNFKKEITENGDREYTSISTSHNFKFVVKNGLITSVNFTINNKKYRTEVEQINGNTQIYFYKENSSLVKSMKSVSMNYSLENYSSLSNSDELLKIWGQEATANIQNTSSGVDRNSPMFYGSYDWHSSAHGQLAASYVGATTNTSSYLTPVVSRYTNYNIYREKYYSPRTNETLYGYPWLLLHADNLATNNVDGYNKLKPFSDFIYNKVKNYVMSNMTQSKYLYSVTSGYYNYNFALYGLYTYADRVNDTATKQYIKSFILNNATGINWATIGGSDFFDARSIAILLYNKVGITSGTVWNNLFNAYQNSALNVPSKYQYSQYSSHSKGRIASSAWGYMMMYKLTKSNKYKNAYISVIDAVYSDLKSQRYSSNYFATTGHWIPHFGTFALKIYKDANIDDATEPEEPNEPEEPVIDLIKDIVVYPNPFTNYINVKFPCENDNQLITFSIINWAGRTVGTKQFYANKGNQEIRFDGLSYLWAETYVLVVKTGTKRFTKKIIKKSTWSWW